MVLWDIELRDFLHYIVRFNAAFSIKINVFIVKIEKFYDLKTIIISTLVDNSFT